MVLTILVVAISCQSSQVANPSPLPSPTPNAALASIVLTAADLPSQLARCSSSGPLSAYITALQPADPALAQSIASQWLALQKAGAREAAISLFTSDARACNTELAASGTIKAAASLVVEFGDEGQADRAWQAGMFGFIPPAPGETPPGVARGTATGLGASAWTYRRAPVQLASWRRSVFVALVVLTNLDAATFAAATAAVDARLH